MQGRWVGRGQVSPGVTGQCGGAQGQWGVRDQQGGVRGHGGSGVAGMRLRDSLGGGDEEGQGSKGRAQGLRGE